MCVCWEHPQCYLSRMGYFLVTNLVVLFESWNFPGMKDVFPSSTPQSRGTRRMLFHREGTTVFFLSLLGNLARSLPSLQVGFPNASSF